MTTPRQVLRGTTSFVTNRCVERQHLLRPSRLTNQVFEYVLAMAAKRHAILVHTYCVMSNHYHLVVTDPDARLPEFEQYLDGLVARAMNVVLDRRDRFWSVDGYSSVELPTPEDVADKAAYALANPVAAGLVERGRDWPGLWSAPELVGAGPRYVPRPGVFFSPNGDMPAKVALEVTAPPGWEAEAFRAAVRAGLAQREAEARWPGRRFLGVAKVLAISPRSRPETKEPRRGLRPKVATWSAVKRREVLVRLHRFVDAYRDALGAWQRGARQVVFPEGTYQLRVAHGAACVGYG